MQVMVEVPLGYWQVWQGASILLLIKQTVLTKILDGTNNFLIPNVENPYFGAYENTTK